MPIDGKYKHFRIHRLVAITYLPNPNNLPDVDHIDRNRSNNCVSNLRWISPQENSKNKDWDAISEAQRERCLSIPDDIRIKQMKEMAENIARPVEMRDINDTSVILKVFPSSLQAAIQEFGDPSKNSLINRCANGKRKSAYGYNWTFVLT